MTRKQEIQARMAELQKEFSTLNAEKKEIDDIEKRAINRERYKDYHFKVVMWAYKLYKEEDIKDLSEEDRETAGIGASGLAYCDIDQRDGSCAIMLKDKTDYSRAQRVLTILEAVEHLKDEKERDKEKYIKVLLGES